MRKILVYLIIFSAAFLYAQKSGAWSDDVSGVLMPSPRGGAGITSETAATTLYGSTDTGSEDPPVLINWDVAVQ